MSSFHITLPSNSSMDLYSENKISHFTTQLQHPFRVFQPYEVGLAEITFDHCWDLELGFLTYFFQKKKWHFFKN
jgi:hypothetical protein